MTTATETAIIPSHRWPDANGEVLIVRCADKHGKSYNGFQNPLEASSVVEAADWEKTAKCGNGLHGWPLGLGLGDGKDPDYEGLWYVVGVKPEDIVGNIEGGSKCKFRGGTVRYVGHWVGALSFSLAARTAWIEHASSGAASATGWRGAASATGGSGAASATGGRGAASATGGSGAASATGERGAASATGWSGAASATGERGAASATGGSGAASATGWRGAASATGESGAASATGGCNAAIVTGADGRAKCADGGMIGLAFYNKLKDRYEMRCSIVGEGGLKPDVWYCLNESGEFVEESA